MPATVTPADRLRARAAALRSFARQLEQLDVLGLPERAGVDTWMGPSPHACDDWLRATRTRLLSQADQLAATARRFERQAAELAALAATTGPR